MTCPGPKCAAMILEWLRLRTVGSNLVEAESTGRSNDDVRPLSTAPRQGLLWTSVAYSDDAPAIRSDAEWAGAVEHLRYAVFRRYQNQLTRAERARLDNTIQNALYKMERYLERLDSSARAVREADFVAAREEFLEGRERAEKLRRQGRRAEAKLAQLSSLTPEGFEEFVGEVFEALGHEVEHVGGTGDEGADLRLTRDGLRAVVQCKYFVKGVVGSPDLQKFLGTVHHNRAHKGYFVTTRTFSLAAERFAADHPIELIDGPRLVELVREAMGPGADKESEPTLF